VDRSMAVLDPGLLEDSADPDAPEQISRTSC
jgi:hypothetical protein